MFEASLDSKTGRFQVPLDAYTKLNKNIFVTVDPKGRYLELRSENNFALLVERLSAPRPGVPARVVASLRTHYLGFSAQCQFDAGMRLVIPKKMRELFEEESDLILIGVGECLQVWQASVYRERRDIELFELVQNYPDVDMLIMGIDEAELPGTIKDTTRENVEDGE